MTTRVPQAAPKKWHLDQAIGTSQGFGQRSLGRTRTKDTGTSELSFGTEVFSESRSSACHSLSPQLCVVLVKAVQQLLLLYVKEELTQGIWEVMRCISELDSALELFHHGKILCCWPQKRCCHSPPPAEVSFKQFLVFLTTKQSWEKSP